MEEGLNMKPDCLFTSNVPLNNAAYTDWLTTAIHSSLASSCKGVYVNLI